MASEPLRSIYQLYKHDTEIIASWLATTAKAHGYSNPWGSQAAPAATKPSTRLKGKARKEAKEATPAPAAPTNQNGKAIEYTLAIRDFVPLAEHIAAIKHGAVKIPEYFSAALERVIRVRSSFAEKLEKAGKNPDMQSDARHTFFVKVLEDVRKVLKPLMSTTDAFNVSDLKSAVPKTTGGTKIAGGTTPLKNVFEVLEMYEPSAAFENAPDIELPKPIEPEYMVKEENDSLSEALFGMTTLMDDLSRMRSEIADLWAKYEKGDMDLAAVSAAADTAIGLARGFEEDIKPFAQQWGGSTSLHIEYFYTIANAAGIDPESLQCHDDAYNLAAYDIADSLFYNTLIHLIIFFHVYQTDANGWLDYDRAYGWYDEDSTRVPKTRRQRYAKDKTALMGMLTDLALKAIQWPFTDQLFRGVMQMRNRPMRNGRPEVPIWVSFAAQIYLDTLNNVTIGRDWNDMQAYIHTIQPIFNAHNHPPSAMGKLVEFFLDENNKILIMDPIAARRRKEGHSNYRDYTFYRRYPTYYGLWVNFVRNAFHDHGFSYASGYSIMFTIQLYQALHQEKLIDAKWVELETLWKAQGNAAYFVGDPPTAADRYWKNLCITTGLTTDTSNTILVRNKRDKNIKSTRIVRRRMRRKGLTSRFFFDRVGRGDDRLLNPEVIQDCIVTGAEGRKHHDAQPAAESFRPLLHNLATVIHAEVPDLEFNYFALHDDCQSLLLRINLEIKNIYSEFRDTQHEFNGTSGYVIACAFEDAARRLDTNEEIEPTMSMLEAEGKILCEWLKRR